MITSEQFEAALAAQIKTIRPRLEIGLEKVGELAESLAAHYPGDYQPGWAPLAASTLADKEAKGFPVPSPLKRTGDMAASYKKEVDPFTLEMVIGSPELKAFWQEMGTVHIPPRPVCEPALKNSLPYAADVFGKIAMTVLMLEKK